MRQAHQQLAILTHIKTKPITKLEALSLYGILNMGDVILHLRRKGHHIVTHMIPRSEGSPFASYSLER